MSRVFRRPAFYFLYGCIGATLIYPRFRYSGSFDWWVHNRVSDITVNICIVLVVLSAGSLSAAASQLGSLRNLPPVKSTFQVSLKAVACFFLAFSLSLACLRAAQFADPQLGDVLTTYGILLLAGSVGGMLGQVIGGPRIALAVAACLLCCLALAGLLSEFMVL
jgi:nitrate/nitrite transporter NarK